MKIDYAVQIIWSPEDKAYLAMPAELMGCMADGSTPEEALSNLRVVIEEWIETATEEGRPIPQPMTVMDVARIQDQSQEQLRKYIENEVTKAVDSVLSQLAKSQQSSAAWGNRGSVPFETLEGLVRHGGR